MALTTVRVPDHLLDQLDELAKQRDVSRSELVREALERYCRLVEPTPGSRRELVESLVDYGGSGRRDGAEKSEQYLRRMFDDRRHDRSR